MKMDKYIVIANLLIGGIAEKHKIKHKVGVQVKHKYDDHYDSSAGFWDGGGNVGEQQHNNQYHGEQQHNNQYHGEQQHNNQYHGEQQHNNHDHGEQQHNNHDHGEQQHNNQYHGEQQHNNHGHRGGHEHVHQGGGFNNTTYRDRPHNTTYRDRPHSHNQPHYHDQPNPQQQPYRPQPQPVRRDMITCQQVSCPLIFNRDEFDQMVYSHHNKAMLHHQCPGDDVDSCPLECCEKQHVCGNEQCPQGTIHRFNKADDCKALRIPRVQRHIYETDSIMSKIEACCRPANTCADYTCQESNWTKARDSQQLFCEDDVNGNMCSDDVCCVPPLTCRNAETGTLTCPDGMNFLEDTICGSCDHNATIFEMICCSDPNTYMKGKAQVTCGRGFMDSCQNRRTVDDSPSRILSNVSCNTDQGTCNEDTCCSTETIYCQEYKCSNQHFEGIGVPEYAQGTACGWSNEFAKDKSLCRDDFCNCPDPQDCKSFSGHLCGTKIYDPSALCDGECTDSICCHVPEEVSCGQAYNIPGRIEYSRRCPDAAILRSQEICGNTKNFFNECSIPKCCGAPKTCASHSCQHFGEKYNDIMCGNDGDAPCSDETCCEAQVECSTYTGCANGVAHQQQKCPLSGQLACCQCNQVDSCEGYSCTKATLQLRSDAADVSCLYPSQKTHSMDRWGDQMCSDVVCCDQLATCENYDCMANKGNFSAAAHKNRWERCPDDQCDFDFCCAKPVNCDTVNCPAGRNPILNASDFQCAWDAKHLDPTARVMPGCSQNTCCSSELTCETYYCGQSRIKKKSANYIGCRSKMQRSGDYGCTHQECCLEEITCTSSGYQCSQGLQLNPDAANSPCGWGDPNSCNDHVCCKAPATCDTFRCSAFIGWVPKVLKIEERVCGFLQECPREQCCQEEFRCKGPNFTFSCGNNSFLRTDAHLKLCGFGSQESCTPEICCDNGLSCADFNCSQQNNMNGKGFFNMRNINLSFPCGVRKRMMIQKPHINDYNQPMKKKGFHLLQVDEEKKHGPDDDFWWSHNHDHQPYAQQRYNDNFWDSNPSTSLGIDDVKNSCNVQTCCEQEHHCMSYSEDDCPKSWMLKPPDQLKDISCGWGSQQCSHVQCCDPIPKCSEYQNCPQNYLLSDLECASGQCNEATCCIAPLTCGTYSCGQAASVRGYYFGPYGAIYKLKESANDIVCGYGNTASCRSSQCCKQVTTCDNFECEYQARHINNDRICDPDSGQPCTVQDCCESAVTCEDWYETSSRNSPNNGRNSMCPTGFRFTEDAKDVFCGYGPNACTIHQCCESPNYCNQWNGQCAVGYNLRSADTSCGFQLCTDEHCCEPPDLCQEFPCPERWTKPNPNKICGYGGGAAGKGKFLQEKHTTCSQEMCCVPPVTCDNQNCPQGYRPRKQAQGQVLGYTIDSWDQELCCEKPIICDDRKCGSGLKDSNPQQIVGFTWTDWKPEKCCLERVSCSTFPCREPSRVMNDEYICGWQPFKREEKQPSTVFIQKRSHPKKNEERVLLQLEESKTEFGGWENGQQQYGQQQQQQHYGQQQQQYGQQQQQYGQQQQQQYGQQQQYPQEAWGESEQVQPQNNWNYDPVNIIYSATDPNGLCNEGICCEQPVTCQNHSCIAQESAIKHNSRNIICGFNLHDCSDELCCDLPPTCSTFKCPDDWLSQHGDTICRLEGCHESICCISPIRCAAIPCENYSIQIDANKICGHRVGECSQQECCRPPKTCSEHSCAAPSRWKLDYDVIICLNEECRDEYCCDDPPTCASFMGLCEEWERPANHSVICEFTGCTPDRCCQCGCCDESTSFEQLNPSYDEFDDQNETMKTELVDDHSMNNMKNQKHEKNIKKNISASKQAISEQQDCECINGNTPTICTDLSNQCESCKPEFRLNIAEDKCDEIICTCEHGTPATGPQCFRNDEICTSCDEGYGHSSVNHACELKICTCMFGTPQDGALCTGGEICKDCNIGYEFLSNTSVCIPKKCSCLNGDAKITMCDPEQPCQSCHAGFSLNDGYCVANECDCAYGIPAIGPSCSLDGAIVCAACDDDYGLTQSLHCKPTCGQWKKENNVCEQGHHSNHELTVCESGLCTEQECCQSFNCPEVLPTLESEKAYSHKGPTTKAAPRPASSSSSSSSSSASEPTPIASSAASSQSIAAGTQSKENADTAGTSAKKITPSKSPKSGASTSETSPAGDTETPAAEESAHAFKLSPLFLIYFFM